MTSTLHFSSAFERVFQALNPHTRPVGEASFPNSVRYDDARIGDDESPAPWLRRLSSHRPLSDFVVYKELAFHAEIKWDTRDTGARVLIEAHAQALVVVGSTIERFLKDESSRIEAHYLRADFEPKNLGSLFHDPVPHVHALQKGPPRFPVSTSRSLPHVDFVELLHHNFFPNLWEAWADRVWMRASKKTKFSGARDPQARIKSAFRASQHETIMASFAEPVSLWQTALTEAKRKMCPLLWHTPYELLGY